MNLSLRLLASLVLPWSLTTVVSGHDASSKPVAYAEKAAHAPRPLPDRVVLTWTGDPATTQAVTWRTDRGNKRRQIDQTVTVHNRVAAGRHLRLTVTFGGHEMAGRADLSFSTAAARSFPRKRVFTYEPKKRS